MEIQADIILEAAEVGKDGMPSGEYLRMANEAKSLWDQAQQIKGAAKPPVDLKAPAASVNAKALAVNADLPPCTLPKDIPPKVDDQPSEVKLIELWVVWETDTIPIIGIKKWEAELVSAFVHLDAPKMKQICKENELEELFDDLLAILTYKKVAQILLQTGAMKGQTKEVDLIELLKKFGKKGKVAVLQYFAQLKIKATKEKKEDKRPKRGEHIINNGVLNLHRDIINIFLSRSGITSDGLGGLLFPADGEESRIIRDCSQYFDSDVARDIQQTLKVHFDQNESYIDANALLYGRTIELLRELAVQHMLHLYWDPLNKGTRHTQPLRATIQSINKELLYVDQNALRKWRQENRSEFTYMRAKNAVWTMFDGLYDRLGYWIMEIKRRRPNQRT